MPSDRTRRRTGLAKEVLEVNEKPRSRRGAANILEFNTGREDRYVALIGRELARCKKAKLRFEDPSQLAAYLADITGIHRTTFGRNLKYRSLLTSYLSGRPGSAVFISDDTDDAAVLRAKLALARAEIGNLRREVDQLSAQRVRVEQSAGDAGTNGSTTELANLYMLLTLVLVRADTFALDRTSRTLVDLAARPDRAVVATAVRAGGFISWTERNQALPSVAQLRRL